MTDHEHHEHPREILGRHLEIGDEVADTDDPDRYRQVVEINADTPEFLVVTFLDGTGMEVGADTLYRVRRHR